MRKVKSFFVTALLLTLCGSAEAQIAGRTFAAGGPLGIYVALGNHLPSPARPVNGGTAYLVERRISGHDTWDMVATVSAPATLQEFRSNVENDVRLVPLHPSLAEIPVDSLWQIIGRYGLADSLKFWSGVLLIRLASGAMYLDTTARKNVDYQYRVSLVDRSKKAISVLVSNFESYPVNVHLPKLRLFMKSPRESRVLLEWTSGIGSSAPEFSAFRQEGLRGQFEPRRMPALITARHDSVFYVIEDTLVQPMHAYRYYLLPMDLYGNIGAPSDTATVGTYNFLRVPLPDFISAVSLDTIGGIRVSWHLRDPRLVRNLTIYRSTDFETGYVRLADAATGDTSYIDQDVRPMVKYFYYLVMYGPLGEASPPSAKVFGMYISHKAPPPPGILGAVGTRRGVRLNMMRTDFQQTYFQVFRNDGVSPALHLISGLIPVKDSITVYEDTSSMLSGNMTYLYAVRAENASHVFSAFSDGVHVRPDLPTHPPAPIGLTATVEGKIVQLYWNDMRPSDHAVAGYFVYRRDINHAGGRGRFTRLNDSLLAASTNRFSDTTAVAGERYEYAVRDRDFFGGESEQGTVTTAEVPEVRPIPPGGLRARTTPEGILLRWDNTVQPDLREYRVYRYQRRQRPVRISTVKFSGNLETLDRRTRKGSLYFYFVTAVNTKGVESRRSMEVGVRR